MPGAEDERTVLEQHLVAIASGALPAALLLSCLVGIFYDFHFRGVGVAIHIVVYGIDTLDFFPPPPCRL